MESTVAAELQTLAATLRKVDALQATLAEQSEGNEVHQKQIDVYLEQIGKLMFQKCNN